MKFLSYFFLLCCLTGPGPALGAAFRARPADGGLPGEWLTAFSAGARESGMAGAATALTGGAAAYANPAGIAANTSGEVVMLVAPLIFSGQYQAVSVSHPISRYDNMSISFLHLGSGSADKTDELGRSIGSFTEQDYAFLLSYAQRATKNISIGLTLKAVKQSLAEFSATGFGTDLGAQVKPFENLTLGVSALNLFPPSLKLKEETDKFPIFYKAGAAYEYSILNRPVLLCVDMNTLVLTGRRRVLRGGAAVEIKPFSADTPFAVRFGVNQREYAVGFGVGTRQVSFDYAAALHELETLHRFGITVRFDMVTAFDEKKIRTERLKALKLEARDWLKAGDLDKCEAAVLNITELDEFDADAALITAEVKELRAKAETETRLVRNKREALERLSEAKTLYRSKQYKRSLETLETVISMLQDNVQAQGILAMSRAHILIDERNYTEAMKMLRKAVELEPDNREALLLYKRVQDIIDLR